MYRGLSLFVLSLSIAAPFSHAQIIHPCATTLSLKRFWQSGFNLSTQFIFHVDEKGRITARQTDATPGVNLFEFATTYGAYPLGFSQWRQVYRSILADPRDVGFFRKSLDTLQLQTAYHANRLAWIPSTGPLVIVANHPLAGAEAMAIADLVLSIRPDLKIMMNEAMRGFPELLRYGIFVNPFKNGQNGENQNFSGALDAIRHVRRGGALLMMPSGQVSDRRSSVRHVAVDGEWNSGVARIIEATKASVSTIFVHGEPSAKLLWGRWLHPISGSAVVVNELLNPTSKIISLSIGQAIPYQEFEKVERDLRTLWLRGRVYALSGSHTRAKKPIKEKNLVASTKIAKATIQPVPMELLEEDIAGLRSSGNCLVDEKNYEVFISKKRAIPGVLREIGRLRELAFREVGEGSGKELDLDAYDDSYYHLFVWNKSDRKIMGAYRLGLLDELMQNGGYKQIYNTQFYEMNEFIQKYAANTIELGRSFVAPEYQKNKHTLFYLFKGIGRFVLKRPQYHYLLGSVSLSRQYRETSQQLAIAYLRHHYFDLEKSASILAKHPPVFETPLSSSEASVIASHLEPGVRSLSMLLASIERPLAEDNPNGKGMPDLFRPYLDLGGKFLAFNVDRDFNSIDGLFSVDLHHTEPRYFDFYLGKGAYEEWSALIQSQ